MDAFFIHALSLLLFHIAKYPAIPVEVCFFTGFGSAFNMIGWLLCSEACVNGIAGPAQAIVEL
jgi:hypothetical protein